MTLVVAKGLRLRSGRYELERLLGQGGAASVWLARDTLLERPVAVKVLTEGLIEDQAWLARFKREARVAAGLQHPNLVSIYDFDAEGERPYLVMAYLSGGSLHERLAHGGAPDPERLAGDLLRALAHIHDAGIIHRDVKPGNVLLAPDGRACLSDFGVARPEDATAITKAGEIPGTARYMAPELWRDGVADERSDLYSAGVLLSQCLREDTPARVTDLVARLSAEDRELRPASAAQALTFLAPERPSPPPAPVASHEAPTLAAARPADRPPVVGAGGARGSRRPAIAALCAVALVAGVVVANALVDDDEPAVRSESPARSAPSARSTPAAATSTGDTAQATPPAASSTPAPGPAADGAALNNQGHRLIRQGRYEQAIPVLERAVAELRDSGGLDYAFALFNLGNALRLAGRPEEAIPILEQRLAIPNQTKVVQAELKQARKDLKAQGKGE